MKLSHLTLIISALCALMLALSFAGPVEAKEVYRNQDGDIAVRGAPCVFRTRVDGEWEDTRNLCKLYQNAETGNTIVWIGNGRMLIRRDPQERGFARLYRIVPGTDELGFMGNAVASGSCWVGRTMEFCAR